MYGKELTIPQVEIYVVFLAFFCTGVSEIFLGKVHGMRNVFADVQIYFQMHEKRGSGDFSLFPTSVNCKYFPLSKSAVNIATYQGLLPDVSCASLQLIDLGYSSEVLVTNIVFPWSVFPTENHFSRFRPQRLLLT